MAATVGSRTGQVDSDHRRSDSKLSENKPSDIKPGDNRLSDNRSGDHKLSALVSSATKDLSTLMRDEIALAKAEVRRDVKQAATGSGLFAAAAVLAVFALIMLSFAAAYGIHNLGLGLAWAWLIVAGAYLLIGALCGLIGKLRLKRIHGVDATKRTANKSIAVLKRSGL